MGWKKGKWIKNLTLADLRKLFEEKFPAVTEARALPRTNGELLVKEPYLVVRPVLTTIIGGYNGLTPIISKKWATIRKYFDDRQQLFTRPFDRLLFFGGYIIESEEPIYNYIWHQNPEIHYHYGVRITGKLWKLKGDYYAVMLITSNESFDIVYMPTDLFIGELILHKDINIRRADEKMEAIVERHFKTEMGLFP